MKISQKLVLLFLLNGLIPTAVVGGFSYFNTQRALDQQIKFQLENTLNRQANKVDELVAGDIDALSLFALRVQMRLVLDRYNQTHRPADQQELASLLASIQQDNRGWRRLHLLDTSGKVLASSDSRFTGKDYAGSAVFSKGKSAADVSLFFKDIDGTLGHYLVSPINQNGKQIGVALIESQAVGYQLITSDYTDTGKTGETFLAGAPAAGQSPQYLLPLRFKPDAVLTTYQPPQSIAVRDYRDQAVLQLTKTIERTGWTLAVKMDQSEIYAPVTQLRDVTLGVIVVITAAMILLGWWLPRGLARRLTRFTQVATRIRGGDLTQRAAIDSDDEIGQLGAAFNQMTDNLLRSRAELMASIRSLPFGFAVVNAQKQILFHNELMVKFCGRAIPDDPAASHDAYMEISESLRGAIDLHASIEECLANHQPIEKRASLGAQVFRFFIMPIVEDADGGKASGVVFIMEDISEATIMERSKDEFFSIASHELRTPLTAIKGNASMAIDYYPEITKNTELKEMMDDIHNSSVRLIAIVNDFLDTSRLEQGKIKFKFGLFPIDKIMEQVSYEMGAVLKQKNLYLKVDDSIKNLNKLPQVFADPDRTKQIIYNLVGNAAKFTDSGGIELGARADADALTVTVNDTGRGIPLDMQKFLFHKFQQAGSSLLTRDTARGTGLGLYISKLLVEGMGGEIKLESSIPGKGSTFSFSLPLKPIPELVAAANGEASTITDTTTGLSVVTSTGSATPVSTTKTPVPATKTKTTPVKPHLLIFEDDPYVQRLYQRLFSFEGYTIELVSDGRGGLAKANASKPALILLDIMMPNVNGLLVLESLKQSPSTKTIPVIIVTNIGEAETIDQAKRLGADGYLIKVDFTPEQVLEEVKKHLE